VKKKVMAAMKEWLLAEEVYISDGGHSRKGGSCSERVVASR